MLACDACAAPQQAPASQRSNAPPGYEQTLRPLLSTYCFACHVHEKKKGDVALDQWLTESNAVQDVTLWSRVLKKVQAGEMPPEEKPQPTAAEKQQLIKWIEVAVFRCDCEHPDPGRVTIHRLNRAEYNNTIRDLLGVDFQPADDFPVDDSGYGFDNIADALSIAPLLVEKYLSAADRVVETAFGLHGPPGVTTKRYPVDALELGYNARQRGDGWVFLNSIEEDDVAVKFDTPAAGDFLLRARAYARQEGTNRIKLTFMAGDRPISDVEIQTNAANPEIYQARVSIPAGRTRLRAVVRRAKDGLSETDALRWKNGPVQKGAVFVQWLEVQGPADPAGHLSQFLAQRARLPQKPEAGKEQAALRATLAPLLRRAYRRPVLDGELERLEALAREAWARGSSFEEGYAHAVKAVLVSPGFLFRGLPPAGARPGIHPLDDYALASRLSYFLWSSMPDDRLFALAEKGRLRHSLAAEVKRMMADPKSQAFVENFAGQWLQIRNLGLAAPDKGRFPKFDEPLRTAMRRETELFFAHVMRADRTILDFIDADYSFLNERLAKHYGIDGVTGQAFQRVSLAGTPRRGVLTQGSILTLTSNPTRTSPVKRGKWVLETLLNAAPPPPPPDVPQLKERGELKGTLRVRMEQHRSNPLCASCHTRMDPIGFSLENYDAIGAWREKDGPDAVDATGTLPGGDTFHGSAELAGVLSRRNKEQFVRAFAEKLLMYALGRGIELQDKCAVDEIVAQAAKNDYRFSSLVSSVVHSTPFQKEKLPERPRGE